MDKLIFLRLFCQKKKKKKENKYQDEIKMLPLLLVANGRETINTPFLVLPVNQTIVRCEQIGITKNLNLIHRSNKGHLKCMKRRFHSTIHKMKGKEIIFFRGA